MEIEDVEFVDAATLVATPSHKRPLAEAQMDGRLHPDLALLMGVPTGEYACAVCGMRAWTLDDATECCAGLIEGSCSEKRRYADAGSRKRTGFRIEDGPSLAEAIRAKCGVTNNTDAEVRLGLHLGYLSKIKRRLTLGLSENTYWTLRKLFGADIPFVVVVK
jgi:hypothetical protein